MKKSILDLKFSALVSVLVLTANLSGCNNAASEPNNGVVTPVKIISVQDLQHRNYDVFLGKIDATNRAQLSFQVNGEVSQMMVRMGQSVVKGEVLARLDQSDLKLALKAAQAQFTLAKSQWQRNQNMYSKKLISTSEYDQSQTNYEAASVRLSKAKTDLSYSQIQAPFAGTISYTYAKPHQIVAAKQPILNLIDDSSLDISVTLPIQYVDKITLPSLMQRKFWFVMENKPEQKIQARFKELSTQPNLELNSYSGVITIKRPIYRNLISGMTGQVYIEREHAFNGITLPEAAWIEKGKTTGQIWRLDQTSQTIKKVTVSLNAEQQVVSGLNHDDAIVIAGVKSLSEGQSVKAWLREGGI